MSSDFAIEIRDLKKLFVTPFLRKTIPAVQGISLSVRKGEVFGFLGPNGAGKTTSIRIMMGLIARTSGSVKLFGEEVPARAARHRVGFLPEAPYFYDYLSVSELLDLTGRIFGMTGAQRRKRGDELIERVGLTHARKTPLRKYSKGMMQRAGIAQALMNDPDLVVCDEPMSGLDPLGRKLVRDILLDLKDKGKTVFFSSHILSDVEAVSDRVAIVVQGKVHDLGTPSELLAETGAGHKIIVGNTSESDEELFGQYETQVTPGNRLRVTTEQDDDIKDVLGLVEKNGLSVVEVTTRRQSLEDLFVERASAHHTIHAELRKSGQ